MIAASRVMGAASAETRGFVGHGLASISPFAKGGVHGRHFLPKEVSAVGDKASSPHHLETVGRQGYRFLGAAG